MDIYQSYVRRSKRDAATAGLARLFAACRSGGFPAAELRATGKSPLRVATALQQSHPNEPQHDKEGDDGENPFLARGDGEGHG